MRKSENSGAKVIRRLRISTAWFMLTVPYTTVLHHRNEMAVTISDVTVIHSLYNATSITYSALPDNNNSNKK